MSIEYPESYLCDILNEVRTIAVVGASSKKHRDSYKVMQSLIENGYKVFPCLLYTSPSPRDVEESRMPSSA